MRWIDRGPEPGRVADYSSRYTPGWVRCFRDGFGPRPDDHYWGEFRSELGQRSGDNCWYCERHCDRSAPVGDRAATLDHFRPLSRFPHLAYDWTNWVFSCRRCNEEYKQDGWPQNGYVDPAAIDVIDRPERFFDYDILTGDIVPKSDLSTDDRRRAWDTIDGLGLNRLDVKFYRNALAQQLIQNLLEFPPGERGDLVEHLASEYVGTMRMVLAKMEEADGLT